MRQITEDEILIRRYLMGEADQEEQLAIEQRLLTDHEYFNTLLRVEEDLTDEYARGEISAQERERFEQHFLNAPERRERVEFARALSSYVSKEKMESSNAASWNSALPAFHQARRPLMEAVLMLAVLLLGASTIWLLIERSQLRKLVEQSGEREAEFKRQADEQLSRSEEMARQLERDQNEVAQMEREIARLQQGGQTEPSVISLVLVPGLSRDQNRTGTARLQPGTKILRLELETDQESYRSYRAEVQTAEGQIVWSRESLKARRDGKAVVITLPVALITRSDYVVALDGQTADGYERVSTYYFRVARSR